MHSLNARQSAHLVLRDYLRQHKPIGESDSRDLEVPIPPSDLDAAGEGFAATCSVDDALKLIEDSVVTVEHIVNMLPIDMSKGKV
jgi:hypothetical protein